jgi:hypothetical protein
MTVHRVYEVHCDICQESYDFLCDLDQEEIHKRDRWKFTSNRGPSGHVTFFSVCPRCTFVVNRAVKCNAVEGIVEHMAEADEYFPKSSFAPRKVKDESSFQA